MVPLDQLRQGVGPACQPYEAGYVVAINLPLELSWFAPSYVS
jgi:hypothetical protein